MGAIHESLLSGRMSSMHPHLVPFSVIREFTQNPMKSIDRVGMHFVVVMRDNNEMEKNMY